MADEPTKDGAVTPATTATPGSQVTPQATGGQETDEWFAEAQKEKGWKTKGEVWTSYKEAERKISEQGTELGKYKEFAETAGPIFDIIQNDPELLEKIRSKASGGTETPSTFKKEDKETPTPPIDSSARSVLKIQIVNQFEIDTGISKLDDESKKAVRNSIGKSMTRWVKPGEELPIENLREIFDDALILAKNKDSKLKTMLDGVADSGNDGAFSSMPSGGSRTDDIRLTPEQEKVASHMPGGVEKYKAGLKKLIK